MKSSGAVSPASRAIPRMAPVANPEEAVGSTTDQTTLARDDPRARPASLRPSGTRRSTTSTDRQIVGIMVTERASDAMKPLKPNRAESLASGMIRVA